MGIWGIWYNRYMTKDEILRKRIRSMARSMEVEGADFKKSEKIMLDLWRKDQKRKKS